jgi:hypothetical protein
MRRKCPKPSSAIDGNKKSSIQAYNSSRILSDENIFFHFLDDLNMNGSKNTLWLWFNPASYAIQNRSACARRLGPFISGRPVLQLKIHGH